MARLAQDAGFAVTELHTPWLGTPPEEAVIEARVKAEHEAARAEQINNSVNKILDAAQQRVRTGPAHRRRRGPRH